MSFVAGNLVGRSHEKNGNTRTRRIRTHRIQTCQIRTRQIQTRQIMNSSNELTCRIMNSSNGALGTGYPNPRAPPAQ